ncbi:MAG: hypothetical protein QXW97_01285 [Candidatus Pacearchaeota archaeon]
MVERDVVYRSKIKHSGIFSFSELYEFLYDWISEDGYRINEKKYSEKISGETKTIEIQWEADKKISDYFKFSIKLDWTISGLKKVEVKKEDRKVTMNSGSIEIKYQATLLKDYESRWENHPFWKFWRGVYDKYIIRSRIDEYEEKISQEVLEIVQQTKAFLALETKR